MGMGARPFFFSFFPTILLGRNPYNPPPVPFDGGVGVLTRTRARTAYIFRACGIARAHTLSRTLSASMGGCGGIMATAAPTTHERARVHTHAGSPPPHTHTHPILNPPNITRTHEHARAHARALPAVARPSGPVSPPPSAGFILLLLLLPPRAAPPPGASLLSFSSSLRSLLLCVPWDAPRASSLPTRPSPRLYIGSPPRSGGCPGCSRRAPDRICSAAAAGTDPPGHCCILLGLSLDGPPSATDVLTLP